ncbi:MAG: hypothetical protein CMN76_02860 [Spirochaetaceae bacterium]|nr:hypothetical protein [Spirochaetaceae bacterium]|tara:strand:- start:4207 stop:4431 length:225 start_codon:yes stop_codon:yes gene_type:complete
MGNLMEKKVQNADSSTVDYEDKLLRLQSYREKLDELCDFVDQELRFNRQKREEWNRRTIEWKESYNAEESTGNN